MAIEQSPCARCKSLQGELYEKPGIDDKFNVVDVKYTCFGRLIEPRAPGEECIGFSPRPLRPDGGVAPTPFIDCRPIKKPKPNTWKDFLSAITPFYCRSR